MDIYLSTRQRIADNVRRLRQEMGLSQEELAEVADFHRTYVSQVERSVTNLTIDSLVRLAIALKVDVVELVSQIPSPAKKEPRR